MPLGGIAGAGIAVKPAGPGYFGASITRGPRTISTPYKGQSASSKSVAKWRREQAALPASERWRMPNGIGFSYGPSTGAYPPTAAGGNGLDWTSVLVAGAQAIGNIFGDQPAGGVLPVPGLQYGGGGGGNRGNGIDLPFVDIVGQGQGCATEVLEPYRMNRYGMPSRQAHATCNPATGKLDWWAPARVEVRVTSKRYNARGRKRCPR